MGLRRVTGVAAVGFLVSVAFLIITLIDGRDLGAPTGMLVGFGLIGAVTLALSRRQRR